jgi:hypothetical protein
LRARGFSSLTELPLSGGRRADIAAINAEGEVWIVEIQVMRGGFSRRPKVARLGPLLRPALFRHLGANAGRSDTQGGGSHRGADPYGAEIVREAELNRMAPASRRALLLRFALAAADRLHRLADPAVMPEF